MIVHVNGENQNLPNGLTVAELLHMLGIHTEQVAVELNLKIVDRGEFSSSVLHDGDTVEILSFIGGGAHYLSFHQLK